MDIDARIKLFIDLKNLDENLIAIDIDKKGQSLKTDLENIKQEVNVKLEKIKKTLAESRRKIIETETSMQSLFDHTADTKAQNRLLLWYTLMLTNIQREKDEQPENYFKGKNFEDKLEDYYSKEDEASALYSEIIKKVTTVLAFWFFNQASTPEEFNKLIEDVEKGEV